MNTAIDAASAAMWVKRTAWTVMRVKHAAWAAMRVKHAAWAALWVTLSCNAWAADIERGERLYEARCGGCHAIDDNRVGPRHAGVVGRRAGSVQDFDYSPALRASRIVWSPALLDQWLQNPEKLVPGQRMGYRLADGAERADIIAFLVTQPPAR